MNEAMCACKWVSKGVINEIQKVHNKTMNIVCILFRFLLVINGECILKVEIPAQ